MLRKEKEPMNDTLILLSLLSVLALFMLVGGVKPPSLRRKKKAKIGEAGDVFTIVDEHGHKRRAVYIDGPKKVQKLDFFGRPK